MIEYIVLGIVITILAIMLMKKFMPFRWENAEPKATYKKIVAEFGEPTYVRGCKGGFAVWNEEDLKKRGHPLYEIKIKDESIKHIVPMEHSDHLYMAYKIELSEDKLPSILGLSKSIWYDKLKNLLWVRCHTSAAIIATIYEIIQINEGKISGSIDEYMTLILSVTDMHASYDETAYPRYMAYLKDTPIEAPETSAETQVETQAEPFKQTRALKAKTPLSEELFMQTMGKRKTYDISDSLDRNSIFSSGPKRLYNQKAVGRTVV